MLGSDILDAVIALAFIYFLLSVVAAACQEFVAQVVSWRARTLRKGIGNLLGDPQLKAIAGELYLNPLIATLGTSRSRPSYLKDTRFADALLETLSTAEAATETTVITVREGIEALPDGAAKRQLQLLLRQSGEELDALRDAVADWFDEGMERLKGVYTRYTRWVLLAIGLALAIGFNVDSIDLAHKLASNPASRDAIVQSVGTETATLQADENAARAVEQIDSLALGLGWSACWYDPADPAPGQARVITPCGANERGLWPTPGEWLAYGSSRLPGWLFTAFAVMLGAPFWFDTLQRLAHLRATGSVPESRIATTPKSKGPEE